MSVVRDSQGRAIDKDNPLHTQNTGANIIQPVDIQARYAQPIQTHNAVNVGANGNSLMPTWIDCEGFSEIAITAMNDAGTKNSADILWSHDGVNSHGADYLAISETIQQFRAVNLPVKARYMRVRLINGDTAAHTMSAWAYLKA